MRRGTRTARASFHVDVRRLRGRRRDVLATLAAADDIGQILSLAAATLDLGPVPELPRPAGAEATDHEPRLTDR